MIAPVLELSLSDELRDVIRLFEEGSQCLG